MDRFYAYTRLDKKVLYVDRRENSSMEKLNLYRHVTGWGFHQAFSVSAALSSLETFQNYRGVIVESLLIPTILNAAMVVDTIPRIFNCAASEAKNINFEPVDGIIVKRTV